MFPLPILGDDGKRKSKGKSMSISATPSNARPQTSTGSRRSRRIVGLMATASFASILLSAGNAMAACTTSQGNPLTGIVGGESVTCTGATTGVTISGGGGNSVITVATGASLANSTIAINSGFSNNFFTAGSTAGGATLNNVSLSIGNDGSFQFFGGTATNIAIQNANSVDIRNAASVSAQNGQIVMSDATNLSSQWSQFGVRAGSSLATFGAANGQSLITGSAGIDLVGLFGSITAASDGLVASLGAGDDEVEVSNTATFAGSASGYVFEGGLGNDALRLTATTGAYNRTLTLNNFESLILGVNSGAVSTANINGNITNITANGTGEVRLTNAASLTGSGNINANNSGTIIGLDLGGGNFTVNKTLAGSGRINIMGTGVTTLAANSANLFSGVLGIQAGTTVIGVTGAVGNGSIANSAALQFDAVTIANIINGTGTVTKTGSGIGILSGSNSFTGATTVTGGTLRITRDNAAGLGTITANAGTFFDLNFASNVSNSYTRVLNGGGTLTKSGTGLIDVQNTQLHTGGTIINEGTLRTDAISRLGTGPIVVNAAGRFALNNSSTVNQATSFLSGAGMFEKLGGGTLTLNAANTFTGGSVLTSGVVQLLNNQGLGTGTIDVSGGATLEINAGLIANNLIGTGQVRKVSAGLVDLTGTNSFTGGLFIDAGTIRVNNSGALGAGFVQVNLGGNLNFDNAADITAGANFGGFGAVTKTGAGRLTLLGDNTAHTGLFSVNQGVVEIGSALGAGGANYVIGANGVLNLNYPADGVFANNLSGAGSVLKTGAGIVDLTGTNTHSGGNVIDQGGIRVFDLAQLGTGVTTANTGASLYFNYAGASPLLLTNPFLDGAGNFVKEGSGDLIIDTANTWTGGTRIVEGRVGVNDGLALGTGTVQVDANGIFNFGQFTFANDITGTGIVRKTASGVGSLTGNNSGFSGEVQINDGRLVVTSGNALGTGQVNISGGAELLVDNAATATLANVIYGNGSFIKDGAGRLILTGANSITGTLLVNGGELEVASGSNVGAAGISLAGAGTALVLNRASGGTTFNNDISGIGSVLKLGNGTVSLTGANTYSGGTTVAAGALRVSNLAALGTGSVVVQAGAFLDLDVATAATWNAAISGAGSFRKSGLGDLTLVSNTLSGGLDVQQGRVLVSTTAALGSGPVTTANQTALVFTNTNQQLLNSLVSGGGQLVMNGTGQLVISSANGFSGGTVINNGRVTLNDGAGAGSGLITVNALGELGIGNISLANTITGAGRVVKTASGLANLTGSNSGFTGVLAIDAGSVQIASAGVLGSASVAINGSASRLIANTNSTLNLANIISGTGGLEITGGGVVTLTGANTYSGGSFVTSGRLHATTSSSVGSGPVNLAGTSQFSFDVGTISSTITGSGTVIKLGTGTASLTGTNTHSGGTLISAGTLTAGSMAGFGSGAVQVNAAGTLTMTNTGTLAFANPLSGAGTLRMAGTGRLDFANAFSIRNLFVDTGRVRLNAVATTDATVASAGTLDGTGRIVGALTSSGIVAPGNSIGTLTVQGNYTQNASGVLEIEFDGSGNIDLLDVTGNATLNGGTIRFVSVGGAEGNGGTFLRTGGTVTGTFATIETVGAQLPLSVIYSSNTAAMAPSVLTARPSTFNAQTLAAADGVFGFAGAVSDGVSMLGESRGVWASGFASSGERSASGSTLGYDHSGSGVATGFNLPVNASISLGAAVGWSTTEIDLASGGGGGTQDALLGSAYVRYSTDAIIVLAGVAAGVVDQSTVRNVSFNGFSGSVEGSGDADMTALFLDGRINVGEVSGWDVDGVGRVTFVTMSQDKYLESGISPLRLEVAERDAETGEVRLGLEASRLLIDADQGGEETGAGTRLNLAAGIASTNVQDNRVIPVRFQVSNAGIDLQGDTRDETAPYLRAGIVHTTGDAARLSLGYEGQFGDNPDHALRAGVALRF
jgi:autotransporter-associated beta strand protein